MKSKNKAKKQLKLEASQTQGMVEGIEPTSQIIPEIMAAILDSISEYIVYQDTEHKLLWVNRAAAESVGLSPDELMGRYCYEVWYQRQEPCTGCPVVKARETGQPQEAEMTAPDGRVWFIRGNPVRDMNGNIVALVEGTLEITERKKAEEMVRLSEEKFTIFFRSSPDAILLTSISEERIIEANDSIYRVTGYLPEEVIGQTN